MQVCVCESGEYEQRGIDLIATDVDAAVAAVKGIYVSPYIVRWEDLDRHDDGGGSLTAHFEAVGGYSTKHACYYEFTMYDVVPMSPSPEGAE